MEVAGRGEKSAAQKGPPGKAGLIANGLDRAGVRVTGALSWVLVSPQAWAQGERPVGERDVPQAFEPAWEPDEIQRGGPERDDLQGAIQARACRPRAIPEQGEAQDATPGEATVLDGFQRGFQGASPAQGVIRGAARDAIQGEPLERGLRGGLPPLQPAHATQDEQQEREIRDGLQAFWFQVSSGFRGEPRVREFQGAPRVCGIQDVQRGRDFQDELQALALRVRRDLGRAADARFSGRAAAARASGRAADAVRAGPSGLAAASVCGWPPFDFA